MFYFLYTILLFSLLLHHLIYSIYIPSKKNRPHVHPTSTLDISILFSIMEGNNRNVVVVVVERNNRNVMVVVEGNNRNVVVVVKGSNRNVVVETQL